GEWAGGSFTLEMWVTGIDSSVLAGADSLGRFLAGHNRWDWRLGLSANGALILGGGSGTIATSNLSWDASTWYYLALVADTTGLPPGQARYTFYRATEADNWLTALGSFIGNAVVNDGAGGSTNFYVGSGSNPGASGRNLTFIADEVHY